MKKLILLLVLLLLIVKGQAQMATVDVTANAYSLEQISIALNQLNEMKEQMDQAKKQWETAKSTLKQAKKTAELLQAVADDKVDFSIISDLGFTDMGDFLRKALCIDPKDYIPNNSSYIHIIASFRSGIGECSNYNNYINTYSK